jgi:hypothetical protein
MRRPAPAATGSVLLGDNVIAFRPRFRNLADPGIVERWQACCAALFGYCPARHPDEEDEPSLLETPIAPLLWPPY